MPQTRRHFPAPEPFGPAELAWFRRSGRSRSESAPPAIYVGYGHADDRGRAWWRALLDELD